MMSAIHLTHASDVPHEPAPPGAPLLAVEALSHHYRLRSGVLPVLEDITFGVHRSSFVAVVGPSGAGKSTLLSLIAGLEEPIAGRILLDGAPQRLGRVGYMPQRDLLHPWRDALDNATVALEVRGVRRN